MSLARRLKAVETKLLPPPPVEMLGSYEVHYTDAGPDCDEIDGIEAKRCTEHGPDCAVLITPISAPIRRIVILEGAKAGAGWAV